MSTDDLIQFALDKGINPNGMSTTEIIRAIQIKEGNQPCYGHNHKYKYCNGCLWHDHCQIHGHNFEVN